MFERIIMPGSSASHQTPAVYQSSLLRDAGVLHSFSTRQAVATSQGPAVNTDTENEWDLAVASDASTGRPSPGYQLLLEATGCAGLPMVHVNQVHGNRVLLVDIDDATLNRQTQAQQELETTADPTTPAAADGLVTATPGMALAIRVADCVPVLLAVVINGKPVVVSAVHAGWRGLVEGILPEAVRTIHQQIETLATQTDSRQRSIKSEDARIIAAIGPCISARHYEVGEQVADAFADANLDAAIIHTPGQKPHVNLPLAAKLQLLASGLNEADIDPGTLCTFDNQADFYSHRRDHGQTGRLAAMIALGRVDPA